MRHRSDVNIRDLVSVSDLRRRLMFVLTLIGGYRILHRVVETVW